MSRPCVFEAGVLADVAAWTAHRKWTRAHLTAAMGDAAVAVEVTPDGHVRQLRHHLKPFFARFSALPHPARAVCCVLLGAYADRVVIGAWNPML